MAPSDTDQALKSSPSAIRVLIVDNDSQHARAMSESLARIGYDCTVATSGPEGAGQIKQSNFGVVVTDLVMNDVDGMEILRLAKSSLPDCEVILVTGHATVPMAVEAMQTKAFNVLEKPVTTSHLRAVVEKASDAVRLKITNLELTRRLDERFGYEGIIFASGKMEDVIDRLRRIAPTDASVLITGDSGTGKELIAQAIHQNSPRKKKPFVAINCAAVSEHLVESELFGHIKGSFTDALADRVGKFEYAHGGTLFLDEVGDMPIATQIKLLRVLEERHITRVGDNKSVPVNVRVLSATNRSLEEAIEKGTFRNDLYYRLKVVTVDLPPLAERLDDIIPLVDFFRRQFAKRHGKKIKGFTPEVTQRFFAYDWPGNVRQLRNVVDSMIVLDMDGLLDVDDLPGELSEVEPRPIASSQSGPVEFIGRPLDEIERWVIQQTLKLVNGNREETARMLGIGARTLYRKLDKYNLE